MLKYFIIALFFISLAARAEEIQFVGINKPEGDTPIAIDSVQITRIADNAVATVKTDKVDLADLAFTSVENKYYSGFTHWITGSNLVFQFYSVKSSRVSISIYSLEGRVAATKSVFIEQGFNDISMDISHLGPGFYFANILSNAYTKSFKFIYLEDSHSITESIVKKKHDNILGDEKYNF